MTHVPDAIAPFYTIDELSKFGISRAGWYKHCKDGRINFRKLGGRTIILREDLEVFLRSLPVSGVRAA